VNNLSVILSLPDLLGEDINTYLPNWPCPW